IVSLTHALCGIVAFPKGSQELLVGNGFGIEYDEHHLVMARTPCAHLFIGRIGCEAAGVSDRSHPDALPQLPNVALRSPKASQPEYRALVTLGIRALEGMLVEAIELRSCYWFSAPLERTLRRRHLGLLAGEEHEKPH